MWEHPNLVPSLHSILSQTLSATPTHREVALQVFQNLASSELVPDLILNMNDVMASIISIISAKANKTNVTARTNACLILQNISFIEACRQKLYSHPGFLSALASVLGDPSDTVKMNALPVLLNTSMATSIRVDMFKHGTFVPSLVTLASTQTDVVREKSLSILRNVANHNDTKAPMFEHPEMIHALIKIASLTLLDGTKLARETALAVIQNISNKIEVPQKLTQIDGFMKTIFNNFSQPANSLNKVARENSLLVCQNLSFPNTTRAPMLQHDNGRFFDALLDVMFDESNSLNKVASEKALATIANMANVVENNLPMAKNEKFINKLIQLCTEVDEERKRHSINILAKIAAGVLFTAPYLIKAQGDVLNVMMGVIKDAGEDLKKWKKGNSNEFWALTFLMNLAQGETRRH